MRLLLDENLPKRLKLDFAGHEVFTVSDMSWNGKTNGELFQLLTQNGFDALLTFDKNLQYQQNFQRYNVLVFVLSAPSNTYKDLTKLSDRILAYLRMDNLPAGPIIISDTITGA